MIADNRSSNISNRLYDLLPAVYRQRDLEVGGPLLGLLGVIAEQVDVVESDIAQLYENWFIETCDDWAVPYIGDLIGYRPPDAGVPSDPTVLPINKTLSARREVANAVRFRRQKGSIRLLEQLAEAVTGWPSRVVELGRQVGVTQSIDHLHTRRGGTADLRSADALDRVGTPFDTVAHALDVRSVESDRSPGAYNIQNIALYLWRLPVYSATCTPAYCLEEVGDHCYTFSILGNDTPLYNLPIANPAPEDAIGELSLPVPIRRKAFADDVEQRQASDKYYGEGRSLAIWRSDGGEGRTLIPANEIIPADLSEWRYRPPHGHVAVDPELGRIAFPPSELPENDILVSYHYAFGMDIGGGEYQRSHVVNAAISTYRVNGSTDIPTVRAACERWASDNPTSAVIELTENRVYNEPFQIELREGQSLEIRAVNGVRPVIDLLDWRASRPDALTITGAVGSRMTLDGILVTGRGIDIRGTFDAFIIRHCTLVPDWSLHQDARPHRPAEPSLSFTDASARVRIDRCIIGAIHATQEDILADPLDLRISQSIVDATSNDLVAIGAPDDGAASIALTVMRSTILGRVHTHTVELAENSILAGHVRVARRQHGCMRYCYVPPGSRTPSRYCCQPDLVGQALDEAVKLEQLPRSELRALRHVEWLRVEPQFITKRYGEPAYCRLALGCADEITHGAEDRSELGVFHDLYEPQRIANLRNRLAEYVPAGTDAGIIFAS
ncbi:hypothetical protein SAMN05444159_0910 [Bradyrhizobium lablabi]|uniref:Uncharacterized protein n=1 Tax=Bradyrhizobium lablabi TaxID=722472 RepID=A0A1M6K9P4_9BRAD|nr:hypothetical protein [Bradyrhizobium lablabi]SHJ55654.1 hypothetical protein SAMN05444159_0910 [Bradyrhizobium lablabi]